MSEYLYSWIVRVVDQHESNVWSAHENDYILHRHIRDHYVVAPTREAAVRQARALAGYDGPGRAGVRNVRRLEKLT